jgi:hypothetical protein
VLKAVSCSQKIVVGQSMERVVTHCLSSCFFNHVLNVTNCLFFTNSNITDSSMIILSIKLFIKYFLFNMEYSDVIN